MRRNDVSQPVFLPILFLLIVAAPGILKASGEEALYVQNFQEGKVGTRDDGTQELILSGASPKTLVFKGGEDAQMPVTAVDTALFTEGPLAERLEDSQAGPFAALDVFGGEDEIYLLKLSEPNYDAAEEALRYKAEVLQDSSRTPWRLRNRKLGTEPPETFGRGALFLDHVAVSE